MKILLNNSTSISYHQLHLGQLNKEMNVFEFNSAALCLYVQFVHKLISGKSGRLKDVIKYIVS